MRRHEHYSRPTGEPAGRGPQGLVTRQPSSHTGDPRQREGDRGLSAPSCSPETTAPLEPCGPPAFPHDLEHLSAALGGFPVGSDSKESAYNIGDRGAIPGSGRSPGEGCMLRCFRRVRLFVPLWTAAPQAPLSVGVGLFMGTLCNKSLVFWY